MDVRLILSCLGLGLVLSLATGLRAFLVPFALACAQGLGWIDLGSSLHWMGSPMAIGTFGAAIAIEICADKVPVVDHAFDVLHVVLKPVAGSFAAVALMDGQSPLIHAVAGLATGGVIAGGTHFTKAAFRVGSTATTVGLGNTLLSVGEDVLALGLAAGATWAMTQLPVNV